MRTIATQAGPLSVREPAPETLARIGALFPSVVNLEDEGRALLALAPIEGERVLEGIRTGYGYLGPQTEEVFDTMLSVERLRIVQAVASFRTRGFRGVLVPAACIAGTPGETTQLGELFFLRAEGPLERGVPGVVDGFDQDHGPGTTSAILSFIGDAIAAWKAAGVEGVLVSDIEPCPADWEGMRWRADVALVDDRVFVIRNELVPEDPLLAALVASGVSEVEHVPSVFLLPEPR